MSTFPKEKIVCPLCGDTAPYTPFPGGGVYKCNRCPFTSLNPDCVDISYKDMVSSPLSNLYPHKFIIPDSYTRRDLPEKYLRGFPVKCTSMEAFLQSLKIEDPTLQHIFCENYSGYAAVRMSASLSDWKKEGMLFWNGHVYPRDTEDYDELISFAYDMLFESNMIFREVVLPKFKDKVLIHSIGKDYKCDTVLTEYEYRYQLKRLIEKLP